jgi:hypothetical protein
VCSIAQALALTQKLEVEGDGQTPIREYRRQKAHIIAALALCETNPAIMGKMFHEAITLDPSNK